MASLSLHKAIYSQHSMMVYLAEMSTPFLNLSWLFKQLEPRFNLLLNLCGILLLLSFFCCRVVLGPYILYHMWSFWKTGPEYLFVIYISIVVFFILMNFYWFSQLIKILIKPSKGKKKDHLGGKVSDDKLSSQDGKKFS